MAERLLGPGDTISTSDPTLSGTDRDIAELCTAAANAVAKIIAAFSLASVGRLGASATQTAIFNALISEAAEQLAMGVVVTGTDPDVALNHGCAALQVNFEKRLRENRESFAQHLADEAQGATKQ